MQSPQFASAATVLATVVIVVAVELTSAVRQSERIPPNKYVLTREGIRPFRFGRLTVIHFFVSMLLYATLFFIEASVGDTPISVVTSAIIVVLAFLPILEIETYDTMLQRVRLGRLGLQDIPWSLLVHSGFWVLAILLLERTLQFSSIGLFLYPFVGTALFLYFLRTDMLDDV